MSEAKSMAVAAPRARKPARPSSTQPRAPRAAKPRKDALRVSAAARAARPAPPSQGPRTLTGAMVRGASKSRSTTVRAIAALFLPVAMVIDGAHALRKLGGKPRRRD